MFRHVYPTKVRLIQLHGLLFPHVCEVMLGCCHGKLKWYGVKGNHPLALSSTQAGVESVTRQQVDHTLTWIKRL